MVHGVAWFKSTYKKHRTYKKKKKLKSIKSQIQINIIPPENEPNGLVNSNVKKKIRSNSSPANLNESLINQPITFQKINKFFRNTNSSGDLCSTDQLEENVILKRNFISFLSIIIIKIFLND